MAIEIQLHGFIEQASDSLVMCETRHPQATKWSVLVTHRKGDDVSVLFDSDYDDVEDAFKAFERKCQEHPRAAVEVY